MSEVTHGSLHRRIKRIGPYTAAGLVLVPLLIVEPLKLVAVFVAGSGHWFTGTAVLLLAYAGSLFVVERLFRLLKPNILRAPALARGWAWLAALRRGLGRWWRARRNFPAPAKFPPPEKVKR